jgi:WD40 repeat protein
MSREVERPKEESLDPSEFPEEQAALIRKQISGVPILRPSSEAGLEDFIVALKWSPDGCSLAAGLGSGQVTLLNSDDLAKVKSWKAHPKALAAMAWSPKGDRIATGGQDASSPGGGKLKIWDTAGKLTAEAAGGAYSVDLIEYGPDGTAIATASGKHLKVWDESGTLTHAFDPLSSTISGVKWRGSQERLATTSYGGVHLWEVGLATPKRHYEWKGSLISLEISPGGKWIAAGCQDQSVHIWKATSGEDLEMSGYPTKVRAICWSPDGRFLVTGGGADITIWDFSGKGPAGSKPMVRPGHVDVPVAFAFRPGFDAQLASIGKDGAFFLWDLKSGKKPIKLGVKTVAASSLAWSPDGTRLAVGYESGDVCLWNVD